MQSVKSILLKEGLQDLLSSVLHDHSRLLQLLLFGHPSLKPVFLKLFYSIATFSLSTRRFRPPSLMKQTQGKKFKEFYLKKALNS